MLRNDGKYEIFILEAKKDNDWFRISFDGGFNYGKRWHKDGSGKEYEPYESFSASGKCWHKDGSGKEYEPYESFSASGKCWQETGVHGTYDVEQAIKLYLILMENNPDYMFQVVKKTIWQDSEVLWCGKKKEYNAALQNENS